MFNFKGRKNYRITENWLILFFLNKFDITLKVISS